MRNEVLRLERVTQIVDGVTFLDNLSIHIFEGEIMGMSFINAHGKEELVRLLYRNTPIHYGYVYFQEALVNHYGHSSMSVNRVAVIEKQSRLVEDLTVADNIFVLRRGFKTYRIRPHILETQLRQFTGGLGLNINANSQVSSLSFFERCVVELLKAVVTGVRLVIVRDISNFVSAVDLKKIHSLLRHFAAQGVSFLYICNHHEEAFKICDRFSLMEDGRVLKVLDRENFSDELVMHYALDFRVGGAPSGDSRGRGVLEFREVCTAHLDHLSFTAEEGECVVLLDMNNAALPDLLALMADARPPSSGSILLDGSEWTANAAKLRRKLALIGEYPVQSTLFPEMSFLDNLCFPLESRMPRFWGRSGIRKSVAREYEPLIGTDIHAPDITALSPFSLYNLVYYRVLLAHPKAAFCVQPFSGADMYLRHHIVGLINRLQKRKIAVIIPAVSVSDCLSVADRLLVIENGRLTREYHREEFGAIRANL